MQMRVLFALDGSAYRDEVVSAFKQYRPHFGVWSVDLRDMTFEALHFRPHLVVFDGAGRGPLVPSGEWAWVQLFRRAPTFAIVQIGRRYRRVENIGVEDLRAIADEVEEQRFGDSP